MKKDFNKRTLWVGFLNTPTEEELQDATNKMKDGKAYLFINSDGLYEINNKRHIYNFVNDRLNKKFVRKLIPTK